MCLVVLLAGLTTPKDSPQRRSHIICSHLLGSRLPPSLPPYQITDPTKHITMRVLTFAAVCMASASAFHVSMMATPASGPRFHKEIMRPFREGRAFKVIAGLTNFDRASVARIARAAGLGGATHLDLAADPELVALVKAQAPRVRTMVSAIDPEKFVPCVEAGVDMLELGNFDAFYASGLRFSSLDILDLTKRTQALCPRTPLSVTIPHVLAMEEQAQLALSLAALGVDVIQTEGAPSISTMSTGLTAGIEKAAPALAATYVLSRALAGKGTHVMAASGMNEVTAPMALVSGAQGVGVGTAITSLGSEAAMATKVREIVRALQRNKVQMH